MKLKRLNTGEAAVGNFEEILFTGGIGSCVVICLWDPITLIGGMAHMPLPDSKDSFSRDWFSFGIAPDVAFPYLLEKMYARGAKSGQISLRMVGGGNMFSNIPHFQDVGQTILASTSRLALQLRLPVLKGCTGGKFGKSAEFNVQTGKICVQHTNGLIETI